jgi:hypothetical protein
LHSSKSQLLGALEVLQHSVDLAPTFIHAIRNTTAAWMSHLFFHSERTFVLWYDINVLQAISVPGFLFISDLEYDTYDWSS